MPHYRKVTEVAAELHVDLEFLHSLATEDLIRLKESAEGETVLSGEDAERVRLALLLTGELDVNLPGVEVILHMRESMLAMQRQFADILETLAAELRRQRPR